MRLRTLLCAGIAAAAMGHGMEPGVGQAHAQAAPRFPSQVLGTPPAGSGIPAAPTMQAVTAVQAQVMQTQLRAFINGLGSAVKVGAQPPMQVTAAGDHYDLVLPLQISGAIRGDVQYTATARPGPNGSWSVADARTKVPMTLVADVPQPPKDGEKGPARTIPVTYTVNAEAQNGGGTFDPSFTAVSSMMSSMKGLTVQAQGEGVQQTTTVAETVSGITMTPREGRRMDVTANGAMTGYRLDSLAGPDQPAISASFDKIDVAAALNGISPARAVELFEIASAAGEMVRKAGPEAKPKLPPAMMTQLIAALQDLAGDMSLVEAFQGMKLTVAGMEFGTDQVKFAMAGKSEQGLLRIAMDMGYGGLRIPDFGLGELQDLVPRTLSLRPYVTGVTAADLARIAESLNQGRDPSPAEIDAVFSHGGVVYGLDDLSLDIAGSRFTSVGKVTMASMRSYAGTGRITAENFDALTQKLGAIPAAQQAMPAVIFLKGIGRTDAGRTVWDIAYDGSKLLVNGMDLSAMVGGGGGASGGAPKGPPPNRTR